jgi:hypothetical protein
LKRSPSWRAALLLLPQPPLSLLYLLAVRHGSTTPRYLPVVALAAFPALALLSIVRVLRAKGNHGGDVLIAVGAVVELALALVTFALVGFDIAWQL